MNTGKPFSFETHNFFHFHLYYTDNSRPEAGTTLVKRKVGKDGPKNAPFLAFATKGAPLSAPLKSDQWHKNAAQ